MEEELRTPGTYYSLLEELSTGKKSLGDLATALGRRTTDIQGYLRTLRKMRIVERSAPVTARDDVRHHRYRLADDFMRFWFRFVFPFQEDLKTGLPPERLYELEIADVLGEHVSPTFEALCSTSTVTTGQATRVGSWWGKALNEHRRSGARQTEELDVVGLRRSSVAIVGQCKWTAGELGPKVLEDLETFKIPAMRQAGVRFTSGGPTIVLFGKSGFKRALREAADGREDVKCSSADQLVADLTAPAAAS